MGKYSSLAADIIKNVGGKENVESLRHCVTRLRFRLIDESIANDEVIKNMDGVVTVMKAMGEYMVVIGEHVADVYDEVCSQLGLDAMQAENKEQKNAKKKSPLEKVLGTIMGGMGPTLHLLCACGIIKGLLIRFFLIQNPSYKSFKIIPLMPLSLLSRSTASRLRSLPVQSPDLKIPSGFPAYC